MAASPILLLSDLVKQLSTLYPVLLTLSLKAQEKEGDFDRQIAIEETRKQILDETRPLLEAAVNVMQKIEMTPDREDLSEIERKIEDFIALLTEVRSLDDQRSCAWREEQQSLKTTLHQIHLGKQAVTTYQKNYPIED